MSYRGIFVLTLAMVTYTKANSIFVIDGGNFGIWGPEERCPGTEKAIGFKIKVEPNQGKNGDDTALNAIGLKCSGGSWIYSTQGP